MHSFEINETTVENADAIFTGKMLSLTSDPILHIKDILDCFRFDLLSLLLVLLLLLLLCVCACVF